MTPGTPKKPVISALKNVISTFEAKSFTNQRATTPTILFVISCQRKCIDIGRILPNIQRTTKPMANAATSFNDYLLPPDT